MKVTRTPFVPARNSRHRIAALALYRALIKTAQKVYLPDYLPSYGPVHPVAHLVRKRFDNHKLYTSTRLVYSSMAAGYKFLTILTKASVVKSREWVEILELLHERSDSSQRSRESCPHRPPERELRPPLIANIAGPGEPPHYLGTPRPDDQISGPRRIPTLAAIAEGQPFLRYVKPQPPILSKMIGRRRKLWVNRIQEIKLIEDEEAPLAAIEDQWENLVQELMEDELGVPPPLGERYVSASFTYSTYLSKLWLEHILERTWQDWTARGKAMYELLQAERALVEGKPVPEPEKLPRGRPDNVMLGRQTMPTILDANRVSAQLGGVVSQYDKEVDPFISPIWAGIVEGQDVRLRRWIQKTHHWYPSLADGTSNVGRPQFVHRQSGSGPRRPPGGSVGSQQNPNQRQRFDPQKAINNQRDTWGSPSPRGQSDRNSQKRQGQWDKLKQHNYQRGGNNRNEGNGGGRHKEDADFGSFAESFSTKR